MDAMNQIFLQLQEADRYARSKNPHFRRLAVVLLDNLVELQLVRKSESAFLFDRTNWTRGVRKHDGRTRREVMRFHRALLAFAQRQDWITADDAVLLSYAHEVRNGFFHRGEDDQTDAEIAIRLLYGFVKARFPKWRTGRSLLSLGRGRTIRIGDAAEDEHGDNAMLFEGETVQYRNALQDESYWTTSIDRLLTYNPTSDFRPLIHQKASRIVRCLKRDLKWIEENTGSSCMDVLGMRFSVLTPAFDDAEIKGQKISDPMYAVNIYLSLQDDEERLHDIVDINQRALECYRLLDAHRFLPNPMPPSLLRKYEEQVESILTGTEAEGIATFLRIRRDLDRISRAVGEFANDLHGYRERE